MLFPCLKHLSVQGVAWSRLACGIGSTWILTRNTPSQTRNDGMGPVISSSCRRLLIHAKVWDQWTRANISLPPSLSNVPIDVNVEVCKMLECKGNSPFFKKLSYRQEHWTASLMLRGVFSKTVSNNKEVFVMIYYRLKWFQVSVDLIYFVFISDFVTIIMLIL